MGKKSERTKSSTDSLFSPTILIKNKRKKEVKLMFTHSWSERFLFNDNSICGSSNMDDRRLTHATKVL